MTRTAEIDISFQYKDWPDISARVEQAVRTVFDETEVDNEISVVLANDDFVQDLNKRYRGKDKPTNVLSFQQEHDETLGDVILAYETVKSEAKAQNKTFEDHATHLIVHGTLHLIGHDHETDEEAKKMESLEIKILSEMGIKNPYEIENFMR